MQNEIIIKGAKQNNLKNINVKISAVQFSSNLELLRQAERQRTPISYISVKAGKGELPLTQSLINVDGGMLTSFKTIKNGYVLRVVELDGNNQLKVNLKGVKSAYLCDGVENVLNEIKVNENGFALPVVPYSVNTIKIEL